MKEKAFKERIIYQIYPLSFCDSNNDGYGDINGIISKLDYLKDLGIGIIWLSPIYESPLKDNGYDISDYYSINPLLGTMEDFDNLIKEANKRDIKIVMDLVINHTSDQHKWFKEALKDKNSKYRDYYYFRKGNGKKPPNNWNGAFSGSCWEKVNGEENMYYLHLFTKEQPDLNFHNEEVVKEIENILKFYLDKGVYGFRCDVINDIYKTSLDNGKFRFFSRGKEHYENQEGCFNTLLRFRKEVLNNYDTFLVGETSAITPKMGNKFLSTGALDLFFEFDHAFCMSNKFVPIFKKKKFKAKYLLKPLFKWQEVVPIIGAYLENHDQLRSVSRFGNTSKYYKESAKALGMLLLSLKGTIFIYQGEEFGTLNYPDLTYEDTNDCMTKEVVNTVMKILHLSKEKAFKLVNETVNRDHARAPIAWDNTINGGFNLGHKPWIKVNSLYKEGINAQDNLLDKDSILNFYKEMIKLRNNNDTLKHGEFIKVKSNSNLGKFIRKTGKETLEIVINLSSKVIKNKVDNNYKVLLSTYKDSLKDKLRPYEGIIYKIK